MDCDRQTDFEELDRQDCLELLREECVGRVALTARALPIVLPVNFAVLDGDIQMFIDAQLRNRAKKRD